VLIEQQEDAFTLHVLERKAGIIGQSLGWMTIETRSRHTFQNARHQPIAQTRTVSAVVGAAFFRQAQRRRHTDDAGHVLSASAPSSFLSAAGDLRQERRAPADVERPYPFGSVELVRCNGHKINVERGTELEFVIMVIAVSCVKLLSAHNSTQHTSRKHKV
jgi:hypothetical protein